MRRIPVIKSTLPKLLTPSNMGSKYFLSHQLNTFLLVTQQKAARCDVPIKDIPSRDCVHQSRFLSAHTHTHTHTYTHYVQKWVSLCSSVNPPNVVTTLRTTVYSVQDRQCTCNVTEGRSRNHCCRGKEMYYIF